MGKGKLAAAVLALAWCAVFLVGRLLELSQLGRLNADTVFSEEFRRHAFSEEAVEILRGMEQEERGEAAALYLLNRGTDEPDRFVRWKRRWRGRAGWEDYLASCQAIWQDVSCFPVPASPRHPGYTVSFGDSWMGERTFGGRRGHEGTDIMASEDRPGLYPVVSMTDGVVAAKGWLEKGGYRLGIEAPSGAYFYYAHLDSYGDLKEGDPVRAGDLIGFMGNSGYGPEGTTGMFATHLHVGIYLYPQGREVSVNPYWVLRMIEEKKLSCSY